MNDFEEKLKKFRLDDERLQAAMRSAKFVLTQSEPQAFVVETVVVTKGRAEIIKKEKSYV
ncbi:hypothetical protein GCM10027084_28330 [Pseudoxanthomonas sangjuensis]|uniref:hypothetical protein n=1 Tax=Pseudoxanthomonas sangjuensis TaxID=1503750 RepID=UPI0013911353|nr:hypothetical protein [Pseudoxanthomonas sangjuensis]